MDAEKGYVVLCGGRECFVKQPRAGQWLCVHPQPPDGWCLVIYYDEENRVAFVRRATGETALIYPNFVDVGVYDVDMDQD